MKKKFREVTEMEAQQNIGSKKGEEDLDNITGGKESEIEAYAT